MEDLFRSFWWLMFPLAWFVFGGFQSFLNYRRQKDALNLIKTYADKGQEPPEQLLKVLDRPLDEEGEMIWGSTKDQGGSRGNDGSWFSAILFGVMAVGFGYGASTDMYGARDALIIVTFVLAGLCLACLFQALRSGRRSRK
ncbi:hypothetical protein [Brevundimonas lenta]|uniref:Uncharacterized protein n=1 Tax=Brevundimonas lenta TaxID=424796 RepID=A0A7W6JDJ5_9CAUL|nr:hypothetical protein [Brevundimonas lenta]MBB4083153.1 hypothetical protein [Brevundimonas lenta]